MALEPLSIKNMEEKTQDIYEAVVIMSKRAKQILSDRVVDEMISSAEEEVEMGVYDQVVEKTPEDYEELEKVTTLAVNEFVEKHNVKVDYVEENLDDPNENTRCPSFFVIK